MLAKANRITRGEDYRATVRRGRRLTTPNAVLYVRRNDTTPTPRFGFIVSKQVGVAVVRNTVRRRLKALCAEVRGELDPHTDIVIRALPGADSVRWPELRGSLQQALRDRAGA